MVLFRRRIGLGVRGIRVPYLAILLSQCLISSWDLDGDTESVSMSYGRVRWCTYDQIADFNVATGMSARWWDTDGNGGESMPMYLIMGAIAVAAMAGAAIDTGVSAGLGRPDSSSFTGNTPTARGDVSMIS